MTEAKPNRYRLFKWPLFDGVHSKAAISLDRPDAPVLAEYRLDQVNHSGQIHEMLHTATLLGGTNVDVIEDGVARMPDGQEEPVIGVTFDLAEPFSSS
jgi:hypothetical protein